MGDQDGGNKARFLESACITSDVSSSGNSLGIMCTLERLDLPGKIGLICSTLLQDLQNGPSLTTGLQRLHPPTNAPGIL